MTHPIIGIPCATYERPFPYPLAHGNNVTYLHALERAGAAPLLIPLVQHESTLRALFERVDGLLLAGGVDVDPAHYGEAPHPQLGRVSREQDRVELLLVRWAREAQLPMFAICRGVQVLNVAYGGTLYQDIPTQYNTRNNHQESFEAQERDMLTHQMTIVADSRLGTQLGAPNLAVNTLHHQAIKDLAPGLRAVGWANDGLIEAVESVAAPWVVGVQCHPEELVRGNDERWTAVFESFVEAAHTWRREQTEVLC